ncbi:hypothetical protein [uncultured Gemella sp.]|uniref:hypothetical protein n=1 Tax=uncultured Gemella sp. TaxID=254352 RepID=UPI0025DBA030|nr:hypothetical protein [uncultured Gemella sp.]
MNNINEKKLEENRRQALFLVEKLKENVNDLKSMRELSKIVSKDSEMNDDFWTEICNIDFTKIEFFPIRSLLAGILKNKQDNPSISNIYNYLVVENTEYLNRNGQSASKNTPAMIVLYFAGFLGVGVFVIINFIMLMLARGNFEEVLFNLLAGTFLNALVLEVIDRQYIWEWEVPYFENSKFLAYVWTYIPIIIMYLYMNISTFITQGSNYNISNEIKLTIGTYIFILIIVNGLFKLKNSADFMYKVYTIIFKIIAFISFICIIPAYYFGKLPIDWMFILITVPIVSSVRILEKISAKRSAKLLFYPMTFCYLVYTQPRVVNTPILEEQNMLLYVSGVLAILIIVICKVGEKTK